MTGADCPVVGRTDPVTIENVFGAFSMVVYNVRGPRGERTTEVSLAMTPLADPCLVRLQSACLNAEAFGDERCECKSQLDAAMERIGAAGAGVLVYSPGDDGRGVGLFAKIQAMASRERSGASDDDARRALGIPLEGRDYSGPCAVLGELGVRRAILLSASPGKAEALVTRGITVVDQLDMLPLGGHPVARYVGGRTGQGLG